VQRDTRSTTTASSRWGVHILAVADPVTPRSRKPRSCKPGRMFAFRRQSRSPQLHAHNTAECEHSFISTTEISPGSAQILSTLEKGSRCPLWIQRPIQNTIRRPCTVRLAFSFMVHNHPGLHAISLNTFCWITGLSRDLVVATSLPFAGSKWDTKPPPSRAAKLRPGKNTPKCRGDKKKRKGAPSGRVAPVLVAMQIERMQRLRGLLASTCRRVQ